MNAARHIPDDLHDADQDHQEPALAFAPERALWCAVMQQAVKDLEPAAWSNGAADRRNARHHIAETKRWFLSNKTEPLSFLWLCEVLGLNDPDRIRREVLWR